MAQVELPDGTILQFPDTMSEQQQEDAVRRYLSQGKVGEVPQEAAPTQRFRTFLQGVTFGFADEIEAGIRSIGSAEYDELVTEVRGALKDYQEENPMESLGFEVTGAALPALIGAIFTGGAAGAATFANVASKYPTIAKVAKVAGTAAPKSLIGATTIGATQGALTGVGKGENLDERLLGAAAGTVLGAGAGAGAFALTEPIKRLGVGVIDFARRRLGGRGGKIVETELQRLASESGKSIDEIVEGVSSGIIMAENRTLLDAVRGFRSTGGPAATALRESLERRPEAGRKAALTGMQQNLSQFDDPNVLRAMSADDLAARAAEKTAYEPFKTQVAPQGVLNELSEALRRVPSAADEVKEAFLAETGKKPFFSVSKSGEVTFSRSPTVSEAESVRRALQGVASARYRAGQGLSGEAISELEGGLRTRLDESAEGLQATRAQASVVRLSREAFKNGQSALSKNADAVEVEFAEVMRKGPEVVKAYRAGVMQAFRNKMGMGSRKSLMGALADSERKESKILKIVMPEDQLDDLMSIINRAAGSQAAATKVLGGSDTAITSSLQARQGMDIGAGEIAEAISSPNPMNLLRLLGKITKKAAPQLSDVDRKKVVDVLISEDADFVSRALRDESGLAQLQSKVQSLANFIQAGPQRAAPIMSMDVYNNYNRMNQPQ